MEKKRAERAKRKEVKKADEKGDGSAPGCRTASRNE